MTDTARRLRIPGTSNLRDIGGYRTREGRSIATNRVFRSEALVMPGGSNSYAIYDETAAEDYRNLALSTVIDLRADDEMVRAPTAWADVSGAALVEIPIAEGGEGADTNYMRMLLGGDMKRFEIEDMTRFYIGLVERRGEALGQAIRVLADATRLPALVHCAAGKDRTGVLIALLLGALDVADDDVVADFALTGILRPNRIDTYAHLFVAKDRDPEIARVLFESPPESMRALLAHLDAEYGGVRGYLAKRAGVDDEIVEDLRRALLTD
ncbi:tyrosine-protein phosphatase [Gordonia lacunae]|uniref:Protein tyrosine phosphatase n=1 Tax=Gordonia lacunae TaxID=417102 RepID=A0A243QEY4_9ACTN|nr:tyrosine-protein phosphatase [Gordonia lacunae]OUC80292.1 protein tyrosine phosphatase [Gordonia lacunae]